MGRKKKRKKQRAPKKRGAAAAAAVVGDAAEAVAEAAKVEAQPAAAVAEAAKVGAKPAKASARTRRVVAKPPRVDEPPTEPAAALGAGGLASPTTSTPQVDSTRAAEPEPAAVLERVPPPEPATPPAKDLGADLDGDDASYESLVALVASMPDEDAPVSPTRRPAARVDRAAEVEDEIAVVDLDAEVGSEPIDRLIARAVGGAPLTKVDQEGEAPVIDLDADEHRSATPTPLAGPTPTASEQAARLALAAARGAIVEEDVTSFSVDGDEVSTPEARARLLAAALAHAEHQEARYRVPMDTGTERRWKALAASLIFVLAAWMFAAPPGWVVPGPPAQLNAPARARSIRTALLLQAQQVEAFRVENQRLPTTIAELSTRLPSIRYARSGNRAYQLVAYEPDGNAIIYDSANPMQAFRALVGAWAAPEGTP